MNRNEIAMHKHHKYLILMLVVTAALILLYGISGGQAASNPIESMPVIPHEVSGWAKVNDVFVPEGTVVSAWCDGVKVAEGLAIKYGDESWYKLDVYADDPLTLETEGCSAGDVISFQVAGFDADQTEPWVAEQISRVDLTAASTPPASHSVSGMVKVNGNNIPGGITISAWCSGIKFIEASTEIVGGQAVYSMAVPGDDWLTMDLDGCSAGETIRFTIDQLNANETLVWESGHTSTLDLTADSVPPEPHQVYGHVKIDGEFAPEGTPVSAWCGGEKIVENLTSIQQNETWYLLDIPGDDPFTTEIEGCSASDVISFQVASFDADQTEPWVAEQISRVDLTAASAPPAPHSVSGVVKVNGSYVPGGITISAWCGGIKYVEASTEIVGGQSVYSMAVPGNNGFTSDIEGCSAGETIQFKIDQFDANETLAWEAGQTSTLDLTADSVPPEPHQVNGHVKIDGVFAPEGTLVSAWCGGEKIVENLTSIQQNETWYLLDIPGDDPYTPEMEGCQGGETVHFKIGDLDADQTTTWVSGASSVRLDLTAGASTHQIFIPIIIK